MSEVKHIWWVFRKHEKNNNNKKKRMFEQLLIAPPKMYSIKAVEHIGIVCKRTVTDKRRTLTYRERQQYNTI